MESLARRFNKMVCSRAVLLAAALDPCTKSLNFLTPAVKKYLDALLDEEMARVVAVEDSKK